MVTFVVQDGIKDVGSDTLVLTPRAWNDWFEFRTLFWCTYVDASGISHDVGSVKIADLRHEYKNDDAFRTPLPSPFTTLSRKNYVAVGQDDSFYLNIRQLLGPANARAALRAIGDLAEDPSRLESARKHRVVTESLMREVAAATIKGKFNRIVESGGGLAAYDFTFSRPSESPYRAEPTELRFEVHPGSTPPTNVHVLIGRNGSGKTTILRSMARAMLGSEIATEADGGFRAEEGGRLDVANLVYVAFSAFDQAELPVLSKQLQYDIAYSYVGLQYIRDKDLPPVLDGREQPEPRNAPRRTRPPGDLGADVAESAKKLFKKGLQGDWRQALATLESDPNFDEADVVGLADLSIDVLEDEVLLRWSKLSSGHKIVFLIITRLVETVTERTMVLLDEPEGHLHPPLLSALVRALSDLLQSRNGVAIVATHSPVILQEVPRRCAWKIRRVGKSQVARRPEIETFGESVGVLTSEVFSLEVTNSGFHKMLTDAALELGSYEAVVDKFDDELGFEARATLRAWFATQDA